MNNGKIIRFLVSMFPSANPLSLDSPLTKPRLQVPRLPHKVDGADPQARWGRDGRMLPKIDQNRWFTMENPIKMDDN